MDLSEVSVAELKRLQKRIEAEITKREESSRKDLLKKLQKMASEAGVSLDELVGSKPKRGRPAKAASAKTKGRKKATRKVAPKYRNPADTSQTWTGRGRQPAWVAAWAKSHKSLDGLLIK